MAVVTYIYRDGSEEEVVVSPTTTSDKGRGEPVRAVVKGKVSMEFLHIYLRRLVSESITYKGKVIRAY